MNRVSLRERQRQVREDTILDIAHELMVTQGYANMSMDDLAGKVGISKATLYQHFPSKEEVAINVIGRGMRRGRNEDVTSAFAASTKSSGWPPPVLRTRSVVVAEKHLSLEVVGCLCHLAQHQQYLFGLGRVQELGCDHRDHRPQQCDTAVDVITVAA